MVVAARTTERQPEENRRGRLHAVHHRLDPVLLIDHTALALDGVIAVESGGHFLRERRAGQKIPGQLLSGKLIERYIVVECSDHPVAPRPHHATAIEAVPVRIGIARGVEPIDRHPLAVPRRSQQPVDHHLVCARRGVRQKRVDFRRGRRQAGQVERHPAKQRLPIRLR